MYWEMIRKWRIVSLKCFKLGMEKLWMMTLSRPHLDEMIEKTGPD